eukprot:7034504-Karenia_brevis.AAC.1
MAGSGKLCNWSQVSRHSLRSGHRFTPTTAMGEATRKKVNKNQPQTIVTMIANKLLILPQTPHRGHNGST